METHLDTLESTPTSVMQRRVTGRAAALGEEEEETIEDGRRAAVCNPRGGRGKGCHPGLEET